MASSTSRSWCASLATAALALALLVMPRIAGAATPEKAARENATARLVEGVGLLRGGQYAAALARFDEAYALVPSPNIHYNRALAYIGLGKNAEALTAFEAFLAQADHPPEGKREQATHYREELSRKVAHLAVTTDPAGLEVLVDGQSQGATPLARTVYLDPGTHELLARQGPGAATTRQTIKVTAGQYLTVTLPISSPVAGRTDAPAPVPAAPAASATAAPRAAWQSNVPQPSGADRPVPRWTYVAAGGGVVLLGAGLTFGLLARSKGQRLTDDSLTSTDAHRNTFDPGIEDSGLRYETLETIFIAGGAAALVAGAVGYMVARPSTNERANVKTRRSTASVSGQPVLGPSLAGARLMVVF